MGVSLYLIENPKVFLGNCCRPLIYFKSMPKSTKFIPSPISHLLPARVPTEAAGLHFLKCHLSLT
jgi:hypothetical protein